MWDGPRDDEGGHVCYSCFTLTGPKIFNIKIKKQLLWTKQYDRIIISNELLMKW